jgi:phosphoglucosamine mutase
LVLRFGTDGVRGVANVELSPEFAMALGRSVARVLFNPGDERRCLVGRDTRRSGPLIQAALSAGLAAEGIDVVDLGVLPTPGVATISQLFGVPGVVISASHNPFADNGIKVLAAGGLKLRPALEAALESQLDAVLRGGTGSAGQPDGESAVPHGAAVGSIEVDTEATLRYCRHVVGVLEGRLIPGRRVVLDVGNGAAVSTAAEIFALAGVEVVAVIGTNPDGLNINKGCGSTDTRQLARTVLAQHADLGLAFDGDADRVIAVDETGEVVDGDRLLALFAVDLARRGRLADDTLVVTVMSNLGLHRAMAGAGLRVHTTAVGDRAVLEALDVGGWSLGGEQSGHIVFRDLATTGDGVLSGLMLVDLLSRSGQTLATLASAAMQRLPQVLRNVVVADRDGLAASSAVWEEVEGVQAELGETGRVLLRPSGTEALIRVMVEAPSLAEAEAATDRLAAVVQRALGSTPSDPC